MPETKRIITLFENLYHGHPWIDITLKETLENITATQAYQRFPNCNSIWEITNHLIEWRKNVLQRVKGQVIKTPDYNYIQEIEDNSDTAWAATLQQLADTQTKWVVFLQGMNEADLALEYAVNKMTYYEHIQGIIQHDAYHLGQIVILTKVMKSF